MKNLICLCSLFLSILLSTLILQSCSSESGITSPPESKTTTMAKEVVLPTSTINPMTDTTIVLPKSGKTIVVSKKYSAAIIAAIDDYLKNHPNISFNTNLSVTPDAICPNCPLQAVRTWVYAWNFKPFNGKILGIWTNVVSPQNQLLYGFRETYIYNRQQRDAALAAGFLYSNMLLGIDSQTKNYQGQLTDVNTIDSYTPTGFNSKSINRVFIDEPYDGNQTWNSSDVEICANYIQSQYSGTLSLSNWHAPGTPMTNTVFNHTNVYVMCDKYNDKDIPNDFWNPYKLVYGSKNVSNWISLQWNADWTGYSYSDYTQLLASADRLGINEIWLYQYDDNDPTNLQLFTTDAWLDHWLVQEQLELVIWYGNTDCTCNWSEFPNGWIEQNSTYDASRWIESPNIIVP